MAVREYSSDELKKTFFAFPKMKKEEKRKNVWIHCISKSSGEIQNLKFHVELLRILIKSQESEISVLLCPHNNGDF